MRPHQIWMELTGFAWRARRADNVMLGATYYDRRLEVDQLYVRQHKNELTINGEMRWPNEHPHWAQLPFRGQVNATIPDLNRFAELFGATTGTSPELFLRGRDRFARLAAALRQSRSRAKRVKLSRSHS